MNSRVILLCLMACFSTAMCNRVYVHPFHLFAYNQSDCEKMEKGNQTAQEEKTFTPIPIGSKIIAEEESLRDRLSQETQSESSEDRQKESYLIALVNNLGFYLFGGLKNMRKSETVFMSPTNLFGSLVSFYLGASKDTADNLQTLMGFPSGGPNCTSRLDGHIAFSSLKAIDSQLLHKGVNIDASKLAFLFVASGVPLSESFVYDLVPSADALFLRAVAFSDPAQATEQINSFFSGRISRNGLPLLTSVDPSTNLQYASYMHFKGKVRNALPVAGYQDFWIDRSRKVEVPMMSVTGMFQFKHEDRENYLALRVPISENDFLLLVQPTHGNSLEKLESKLTFKSYDSFFGQLANRYVHLTLPKIAIESSYDLQEILAQIKLSNLLGKKADFSKISDADIKVGKILNKVFFELEEGGLTGEQRQDTPVQEAPLTIKLQNPFLMAVFEGTSKVLLFLGSVRNPQSAI